MVRYLATVLVLIFGAISAMYFWIGEPRIYKENPPEIKTSHFYRDPKRTLGEIEIFAFYFIPQNKIKAQISNWRELLEGNLKKLQEFHSVQFQERSKITYEIHPEAITGLRENLFYDTDVTQHGNPEGLRRVAEEIEMRALRPEGDQFWQDFAKDEPGVYKVMLIMYEGVGAAGSENVAFVSSRFLSDPQYRTISASIMAHEFYHTLGIPDGYELESAIPTSQDLMGLGRLRPIEKTYISRETLKRMGL